MIERYKGIIKGLLWGILACALITMCTGCAHTKYVTVPEVHTEYIHTTDSFHSRDTLIHETQTIVQETDSATLAKFGIYLKDQQKAYLVRINDLQQRISNLKESHTDTIVQRDSIPYPVIQEVVKTDKTGWAAFIGLAFVMVVFAAGLLKLNKK